MSLWLIKNHVIKTGGRGDKAPRILTICSKRRYVISFHTYHHKPEERLVGDYWWIMWQKEKFLASE
jgi:hypothetical protein